MSTSPKKSSSSPRNVEKEAPQPVVVDTNTNANSNDNDDQTKAVVIRFANNDKPLGRTISFVIKSLRDSNRPVVLQGAGLALTKVVTVAGIARDRVGDIHQVCEFLTIGASREGGSETTGIQITLSSKDADAKTMEAIGFCEPLKKGFMLAEMPEADRKRLLNRRKSSSVKPAKNEKADDVKNDKNVKAVTGSPKQRDTSAKQSKRRANKKASATAAAADKQPEPSEVKEDVAAAEKQQKRKQKRRNNKKATADENQPPSNSAKADAKNSAVAAASAADKKDASDEKNSRRANHKDEFFNGGQAMRRGGPRNFYNNRGGYYNDSYYGPMPGYYGSPNGRGVYGDRENGYPPRSGYMNYRGGQQNPRQMYPRYQQMAYANGPAGRRGGYGYPRNGDLSGNNALYQQRSNASYRDEILDQSTVKREIGTRQQI